MADADILRITRQGKHMHKRQAQRLLLAARPGNYQSEANPDLTQSELIERAKLLLEDLDNSRLTIKQEADLRGIVDATEPNETDEPSGASGGAGGREIDLTGGDEYP